MSRRKIDQAPQDIAGGICLIAIALLALYMVQNLPATGRFGFASGTAPRLFAYGLLLFGGIILVQGFMRRGPAIERMPLRATLAILGAIVFFGLTIRTLGLALTGIPMVLIASQAMPDNKMWEAVLFALGITLFCALLFPFALGQPIPLWPQL